MIEKKKPKTHSNTSPAEKPRNGNVTDDVKSKQKTNHLTKTSCPQSEYDTVDDVDNTTTAHASNQKFQSQPSKPVVGVSSPGSDYEIPDDTEIRTATHPLKDLTGSSDPRNDYDSVASPDAQEHVYEQVDRSLVYEEYSSLQEERRDESPDTNYSQLGGVGMAGDLYNTTKAESQGSQTG